MKKCLPTIALSAFCAMQSARVSALTTEEFFTICESAPVECTEHPALQAYIGGALDLLATLDEQTDYLETLYCTDPRELFDIPAIIGFMQAHREEYAERNAMLLLVRYFERRGGCEAGQ